MLADWRAAPIDERLRAMLGFLARMTLEPEQVRTADMQALRAAGLSATAIRDACYVGYLFNIYDRLADALGFRLHPEAEYRGMARMLLKRGYS